MTRLYRFYQLDRWKYGDPFAMCDACHAAYTGKEGLVIERIANDAVWDCGFCRTAVTERTPVVCHLCGVIWPRHASVTFS